MAGDSSNRDLPPSMSRLSARASLGCFLACDVFEPDSPLQSSQRRVSRHLLPTGLKEELPEFLMSIMKRLWRLMCGHSVCRSRFV